MKIKLLTICLIVALVFAITVTFTFAQAKRDLTMLEVSPVGGGTTTPASPGVYNYPKDTVVDIIAYANEGYIFVNWTGSTAVADPNSATTTVLMFANETVTANFTVANTADDITAYSIPEQVEPAVIDAGAHTVALTVPYDTDVTGLIASFTLSTGATAKVGAVDQVSGTTPNDFTSAVTYAVTAEDGGTPQDWVVTVSIALNTADDITAYSIPEQVEPAVIDAGAHTVALTVPYDTDVTGLIASFTLSTGATAKVGAVDQVSGTTPNDFTSAVTYAVTAEDGGTPQDWVVTVSIALNTADDITAYSIPEQVEPAVIDAGAHTVALTVPYDTDVTGLIASFTLSTGATAKVGAVDQVSGTTPNDFTSAVTYAVTAEDGGTPQDWVVTVSIALNTADDITAYSIPEQVEPAVIDAGAHTVALTVPYDTDVTGLIASFTLSTGATAKVGAVDQVSGTTPNDFTSAVTYAVTAEDGGTPQDWVVTVSIALNTADDITAYSIPEQVEPAVIDAGAHTVALTVPYDTDVTGLIASFTLSTGATAKVGAVDQVSGTTPNDFTSAVTYAVTAEDGGTPQDWVVTVSIALNTADDITAYSIPEQVEPAVIDAGAHTVALTVPYDTDVTGLIASFTLSTGATAKVGAVDQVSGTTPNDFTSAVTYAVTAEDGGTPQDWVVTVSIALNTADDITAYSIPEQVEPAVIDAGAHTVALTVPYDTDVTGLIASFTLSTGATAKVGAVDQVSGTTPNDFTSAVTYAVTAEDGGTPQDWVVTVSIALNTADDITAYSIPEQVEPAVIDAGAHTVALTVPYDTDVTGLIASFTLSTGATAKVGAVDQVSGTTPNDFTSAVTYAVTAEDGGTPQDWVVTVSIALNTADDITAYSIPEQVEPAVIDAGAHTVALTVPYDTDVTGLIASFTLSTGATAKVGAVDQVSGTTPNDFTSAVTYAVTAEDGGTPQDWVVTVSIALNTADDITAYSIPEQVEPAVIDAGAHTVALTVPYDTDVTGLIASFTLSTGATAKVGAVDQVSGTTPNDFTSAVTYAVTAEDGGTPQDWVVTVSIALNTADDITAYSIPEQVEPAVIDAGAHTVALTVPYDTDVTGLIASFTLSTGATAKVGAVDQVSGTTPNDFTSAVTYAVTAEDGGTPQDWVVTVSIALNTADDITAYSIPEQVEPAVIDAGAHTVALTVPYDTDVTGLIASFTLSTGATAKVGAVDQVSGTTPNDFTSAVTYAVTAEDGGTPQDWVVTVSIALNTADDITAYSIPEQVEPAVIDAGAHTVALTVPYDTDVTGLIASFTLSTGATAKVGAVDQVSGTTPNDFTSAVTYAVTAEDGGTPQDWVVTVSIALNTADDITAYSIPEQVEPAVIDAGAHTVALTVPYDTDVTGLIASFTLSTGATAKVGAVDQVSGTTPNDFTSAVTYAVTAEDGGTPQDWVVTVSIALNTADDITAYSIPEQVEPAVIDAGAHTVALTVPYDTDVTGLIASFTLSTGATAKVGAVDQVSGTTPNDFTSAVTYAVTAEDGGTPQDWVVTVSIALNTADDITAYSIPEQVEPAVIDAGAHTVALTVPYDTDVTGLIASFTLSTGATAKVGAVDQVSGTTPNDFTSAVTYAVTAEDGGTPQDWVVTVSIALNTADDITAYSIPEQVEPAVIDAGAHTVALTVPYDTDVTGLIASFTLSTGATAKVGAVDQVSGTTPNDFTSAVTYAVTAEDGGTPQDWVVTVSIALNTADDITAYSIPEQVEPAVIDAGAHTVALTVPYDTDVTGLIASFTLSTGATAKVGAVDQVSGTTPNDFTSAVTYAVTAEDGGTPQDWVVTVSIALNTADDITAYSIPEQVEPAVIDAGAHTVALTVPYDTDVTGLIASFTLSTGATAKVGAVDQVSGTTPNDFTSAVTYAVTAEDGGTPQDWTVTVTRAESSNADLSGLSVSAGDLVPVFDSGTISYAVAVANSVDTITVTPTADEPATATITVDGVAVASGVASGSIGLGVGANSIFIEVTAGDGTTKTYTVTITRAESSNADLSGLSVSAGTLDPVFNSAVISYVVEVDNSVDTITFTPIADDSTATIKVNDITVPSGVASTPIDLSVGPNSIPIVVTAEDGTEKIYTVTVSVAPNDDATLSDLTVDGTTITGFDPTTLSYSKVLIYGTTTVPIVAATPTDSNASMVITQATNVNGTEEERTATILVTAEDGTTTKTYKVIFGSISVTITKTGPTTANQGDDITYTITYKNEGTFSATNVVITETYPAEVEYVSSNPEPSEGNNIWNIGNLTPGQEGTIIIIVHIK